MPNRLDIVVYGATGYTGRHTLPHINKFAKANGRNLTWGVAGRSKQKLKNVLSETAKRIGEQDINSIPIIIADCDDEASVKRMTAQAKVIVNCCGPYELYGEIVIKSCIETGTHHFDVSIEPLFLNDIELKYCKAAEEKGVYVVSACGVGCIPADLGLVFLEKNFKGTLNSVETYDEMYEEGGFSRPVIHYGSWESLINVLKNLRKLIALQTKPYTNSLPKLQPKLSPRLPFRKEPNKWATPCYTPEIDVLLRSQRYFYEHERKRPVQVYCYLMLNSFATFLGIAFLGFIIVMLSQFKFGRKLLLKHPKLFTAGFISHEEPSEQASERQRFSCTFEGVGWSEKLLEGEDQYKTRPNKAIVGRVRGTNPGYGFTCVALALCAVVILTEPKKLPAKGGVYSSAAVFSKTSLIEQLQENGAVFEILSIKDL